MKWFMGLKADGTEVFSATPKDLYASMKTDITGKYQNDTPSIDVWAEAEKPRTPGERRPHHNSYQRWVKIFRTEDPDQNKFPLHAVSGIGIAQQTKVDYVNSFIKGHWNVRGAKVESGEVFLEIIYRPASKGTKKSDVTRMSFSPSNPITFEGNVCERPKGTFIWVKYIGDQQVANGSLDVDKEGVLAQTGTPGALIRWPKSCLEFPHDPQ